MCVKFYSIFLFSNGGNFFVMKVDILMGFCVILLLFPLTLVSFTYA
jgi:hypothetical protein